MKLGFYLCVAVDKKGAVKRTILEHGDDQPEVLWWKNASLLVEAGKLRHARYCWVAVGRGEESIQPCESAGDPSRSSRGRSRRAPTLTLSPNILGAARKAFQGYPPSSTKGRDRGLGDL